MKIVLLLTGNIAPVNVPHLMRGNAQDRENDYYIAIKKWLEYKIPIVFCENSHYNSLIINELLEGRNDCEYLKFKTQTSHKGKGNGEAEIFQFAFDNSNLLKGAKYIIKVTGRYNVINFEDIQSKIKNYDDFYICGNLTHSLSWADSRFFLFKNSFYHDFLKESLLAINEDKNICFEHCLAHAMHLAMSKSYAFKLLPEIPVYQGYYGGNDKKYDNSWIFQFRNKIFSYCKYYFFESLS
jgi:hypothetical protein